MLNTSANRGTPVSGENITKIIRQHYKPKAPKQYRHEHIRCRTSTTCQKNKPEDYWTTNYFRRKQNLDKGFYSSSTEPYRPIGGELILDPYELVLSALPGSVEKKFQARMTRRGTVYEPNTPTESTRLEDRGDSCTQEGSEIAEDSCESAGFEDIKKLLKESRERIVCVKSGIGYEDHVRAVEEKALAEEESGRPDDTGMVLHSVSSQFIPVQNSVNQSRQESPCNEIRKMSRAQNVTDGEKKKLKIFEAMSGNKKTPTPPLRRTSRPGSVIGSSPVPILKSPGSVRSDDTESGSGKLTLIQCLGGFSKAYLKKERQLRDHYLYLKSIFNVLTALHNMKLKDIRSKVPLSKDIVEKLQKEGAQREDDRGSRGPYGAKFGKTSKLSTMDMENEDLSGRMSVYGTVKRMANVDSAGKGFFGRRRSRNATSIYSSDKPAVETWEDLLNAQPPEFKEENSTFGFQVGIVTKFMRWYRRASMIPTHMGQAPNLDKDTLAYLNQVQQGGGPQGSDKMDKDRESVYGQQGHQSHAGSAHNNPEKAKKLPIWQQVAQEKSSVFHNKKACAPNPDSTIQRFKRDMNKLKQSVQKENTAELEKIIRERVASFRLKFGALNGENCSPLFEEQMVRVQRASENVNRSQLENFDVQPSKWYEELKERSTALVSSFDQPRITEIIAKLQTYTHMDINEYEELKERSTALVSSFDQPRITEIIAKLQTYAHMDNKTLPFSKAKLCLLMMSLPAYDICQIYMQKALKFIFENILLGQEAQFDEWLNHRKIPYVVLDEFRPRSGNLML